MPYADPKARQKYSREQVRKRRREWLETRECATCAAPGADGFVISGSEKAASPFTGSEERRDRLLVHAVVYCPPCYKAVRFGRTADTAAAAAPARLARARKAAGDKTAAPVKPVKRPTAPTSHDQVVEEEARRLRRTELRNQRRREGGYGAPAAGDELEDRLPNHLVRRA